MKKTVIIIILLFVNLVVHAQVNKSLNCTAGLLSTTLSANEKSTITNLTLTGTIDARDFKTMRNDMPLLTDIDLSGVTIVAYEGTEGTMSGSNSIYSENTVPWGAFYANETIETVVLPPNITEIGMLAFCMCTKLVSVNIPEGTVTIQPFAFNACSNLLLLEIPSTVTFFGSIMQCSANFVVDINNTNYSSLDGVLFNKDKTTLLACPVSKTGAYEIPSSVLTVANSAFAICQNLTSLTIPSSVTTIEGYAFESCIKLASITVSWPTPLDLSGSDNVFLNIDTTTCVLYVPFGTSALYAAANQWMDFDNIVELPEDGEVTAGNLAAFLGAELATTTSLTLVGTIDARDFKTMRDDMPLLTNIDLSGTKIVEYSGHDGTFPPSEYGSTYFENVVPLMAFNGNQTITNVVLPTNITGIFQGAFAGCTGLVSVNIPEGTEVISGMAFNGCSNLTTVTIPSTLTYLEFGVFSDCTNLSSVTVGWSTPLDLSSQADVFKGVDKATCKLNVPYGSSALYAAANQWMDFTHIVEMPVEVTAGNLAALLGEELATTTSLTLVGTIDARDFRTMRDNMPLLTDIDLSGATIVAYTGAGGTQPQAVAIINYAANTVPYYAFYNNQTIKNVKLPTTVTEIGESAFYFCTGLVSVDIPEGTVTIQDMAFNVCSSLLLLEIPSTVTSFGSIMQCSANFVVDINNTSYSSLDGVLFNKDKTILQACPGSKTGAYEIPSSVLTVANSAFAICESLTSLTIPSSVTTIEGYAFESCDQLTSITVSWPTPIDLSGSDNVFLSVDTTTCVLYVPFGTSALYAAANQWKDFNNIVEMPDPCQAIASFPYTQDFSSVTFPGCWKIVDNQGNGQVWTLNNSANRVISTSSSSNGFIIIDSDNYGGNQNSDLISPVFDFTNFTNINLEFEHFFRQYGSGSASSGSLSYSINNGNSWVLIQSWTLSTANAEIFSKDLSSVLAGQSQVLFKWKYIGSWAYYWAIDDITISVDGNSIQPNLEISNTIVQSEEIACFNAYDNITVAGGETSVVLVDNSNTTIIAGKSIRFLPGFHAQSGSWMDAHITTNGSFCGGDKSAIVENPDYAISTEDEVLPENKLADILNKSVKIYPNPNNGQFFLDVSNFETRATVSIYTMLGSRVYESELTNGISHKINLSGIKSGVYFVKVTDGKEQFTKKMIVR